MSRPLTRLANLTTLTHYRASAHTTIIRAFTTSPRPHTSWSPGPAPPRLPKEEQEIFERLQRESTGAFSTPAAQRPSINQADSAQADSSHTDSSATGEDATEQVIAARVKDGEELHPNVRRGAPPEFEGDRNPTTGEVGGPKNEPLRWGSTENTGDWSYNGRVSDF